MSVSADLVDEKEERGWRPMHDLSVEQLTRALNEHVHARPAQDGYQRLIVRPDHLGPWLTDDCAAAILAALATQP